MKISLFTQFGALNSGKIFKLFAEGCRRQGLEVVENTTDADILVIWSILWHGRMKGNRDVWNFSKKTGKKLIILEIGGLHRGTTWRIGLDHVNNLGKFYSKEIFDIERPKKLGISLKERQNTGENILICGQHSKSEQWVNRPPPEIWLSSLVQEIKKYSNRPIVFRPHPRDLDWVKFLPKLPITIQYPQKIIGTYDDFNHESDFTNAWCVINPSSNTGIQAAIAGIPVFCDEDSLAYPISNKKIENIVNPELPSRDEWIIKLSHTEWLENEIERGLPISRLL